MRKTGIRLFATYDESGIYPEQSAYFLFNNKSDNSLKYITAILNSKLFQFFYINRMVTNKNSTPQLKKADLDAFHLYICKTKPDRQTHDIIVRYVDKLLKLYKQKSITSLPPQLRHIKTEIEHYEAKINQLVYQLYDLTNEEIKIIEESKQNDN